MRTEDGLQRVFGYGLALSVLLIVSPPALATPRTFTTVDPPGSVYTLVRAINAAGEMVGSYTDEAGVTHGFLLDATGFTPIDAPSAVLTRATGITPAGDIAGWFRDAAGVHGFLLDGAGFTTIDVPGAMLTRAYGITLAGDIVGRFWGGAGLHQGFLLDATGFTAIDVPGASRTTVYGINPGGDIVGVYDEQHGFLAVPRRPVDLGDTTDRKIGIHVVANHCAPPTATGVAPKSTDPNIDSFEGGGGTHVAYYNPYVPERDELHVFLPGTDSKPDYGGEFMQRAASHGMKTIGLQWVNGPNHDYGLCADAWPFATVCMENVLAERTYGGDRSPLVSVSQPNSLVSRLVKLLEYLDVEQPERGWGQYLDGDAPDWGRIVLSGHSQGSAVTALLARDHELMRAVMLAGPYEVAPLSGAVAAFLTDPKATPIERQFGFRHVDDEPTLHPKVWDAMGLLGPPVLVENGSPPYEGSHRLETDIDMPPVWPFAHDSVIFWTPEEPDGTPIFKDAWLYLLGMEAGAPCGREAAYASNPRAAVVEIPVGATLSFDHPNGEATITIPGAAWAAVVAERFGGCSVGGSDGLICESVSDYTIAIDLNDDLAVPAQSYWTGQLIADGSTLNRIAREPDVAADGFFYREVAEPTTAVACSAATDIPAGECLPADLRPPEAYDPINGTFTYLGVVDGSVDPAYGLSRFAIEEVPEPAAIALQLSALAALAAAARARPAGAWPNSRGNSRRS